MDRKTLTQHALTAVLAVALGIPGAALAASQGEPADPRFNKLDTDRDGYLSRAQEIAAGVPGVVSVKNGLVVKS